MAPGAPSRSTWRRSGGPGDAARPRLCAAPRGAALAPGLLGAPRLRRPSTPRSCSSSTRSKRSPRPTPNACPVSRSSWIGRSARAFNQPRRRYPEDLSTGPRKEPRHVAISTNPSPQPRPAMRWCGAFAFVRSLLRVGTLGPRRDLCLGVGGEIVLDLVEQFLTLLFRVDLGFADQAFSEQGEPIVGGSELLAMVGRRKPHEEAYE